MIEQALAWKQNEWLASYRIEKVMKNMSRETTRKTVSDERFSGFLDDYYEYPKVEEIGFSRVICSGVTIIR